MRLNKAVTANQSASAPTMAASATDCTQRTQRLGVRKLVTANTSATAISRPSAWFFARFKVCAGMLCCSPKAVADACNAIT
ncbi:hypothetical protein D3C85_1776940 [compost metagenome]